MALGISLLPVTTSILSPCKSFERKQTISKKPFLLLEILVSVLIVSLCLIPLIESPILAYRNELKLIEEMERERLSEWGFSEVKEKLLNHEIPWARLPSKGEKTPPIPISPGTIEIPGSPSKSVKRFFTLRCTGEKEGLKGEVYRLFHVEILFDPPIKEAKGKKRGKRSRAYRTIVQKFPEAP